MERHGTTTLLLLACAAPTTAQATTVAERAASWERHVSMARESEFDDVTWRLVGPHKQGGRVESVACPPGNTSTIYVGVGAGSVWKSVNNGTTWRPIFDHESTFSIGDIAVAKTDPNIVWVGTGEVLMARSSYAGTGVFRSDDGGETWRNMGLEDSHHIGKVLIDPRDADVVWVAAIGHLYTPNEQRGVFRTADGGKTWQHVLALGPTVGAVDLAMEPGRPDTVYAAMWKHSRRPWGYVAIGPECGLHKTTDGGKSWSRLGGGLRADDGVGRISVAIAPSAPNVVYALVGDDWRKGALYRSDDRGASWRKASEEDLSVGYDFCLVEVAPDDADEVWVAGQRTQVSRDGGRTFTRVGETVVHVLPHPSRVLHLDTHAVWFDPSNPDRVFLGNDGGLYASYDRGATWLHWNNLPIGEFYAVTVDMADPYRIWGGTQDNAALFGPSTHEPLDGGDDPWQHVYIDPWGGGDSYFTFVDPNDENTVYYEHQFGDLRRRDMVSGKSTRIRPRLSGEELRRNWQTPFLLSHYDSKTVYYGANRLLRSGDRGDSWRAISPDLTTNPGPERRGNVPFGTITTIAESELARGTLLVGTDDGRVHVTRDDGGSWIDVSDGLPDKWVSRVVTSRHTEGVAYVSLTGYRDDDFRAYLFATTDYGEQWSSIAVGLPSESINVVREDPIDADILYAGTDLGVYVSQDRGVTWHSLCRGLPTTPVHDLVLHPREPEIVIATHGRSIWVANIDSVRG